MQMTHFNVFIDLIKTLTMLLIYKILGWSIYIDYITILLHYQYNFNLL